MQTREQIKGQMRDNALFIRRGLTAQPLVLEPLVLEHDPLLDTRDRYHELLEDEDDRQTVLRLLEGSETPAEYVV